jgi:hypothetical protein
LWRSSRLPATDAPHTRQGVLHDQQRFSAASSDDAHLVWTVMSMDHGRWATRTVEVHTQAHSCQMDPIASIVRCLAATDELLCVDDLHRACSCSSCSRGESAEAARNQALRSLKNAQLLSPSGVPVRRTDSRHCMQRLRRGSRVAAGCRVCAGGRLCARQRSADAHNAQTADRGWYT